MAKFVFSSNHAVPRAGGFAVKFSLCGADAPFPPREIEARTTTEALAAFEAYRVDAESAGVPIAVSVDVKGRAPNGWKAARAAMPFYLKAGF